MELKGKVVLVTGASRGIGAQIARLFGENGCNVVVNYKETDEAALAVVRHIKERGGDAVAVKADVSDPAQCRELSRKAIQYFGAIDILVNNAGIAYYGPFEKTGLGTLKALVDTNLTGLMALTHEVLPAMKANGSGIIVNISSKIGKTGEAGLAAYCASKFGVLGFTEALGKELEDTGVCVYAVCPGGVDTDIYRRADPEVDPETLIQPEKIARMALALCTGKKKLKNGGSINVFW